MKIAILVAGSSKYFPLFIDKPKCLYHFNGEIQLERVIKVAKKFVNEEDIIIVAGYKYKYVKKYLSQKHPQIDFRVNERYDDSAIFSFRKAIENTDDDIVFMFGDENISEQNVEKICHSTRALAIMCHDDYYYYSLGIMKLKKNCLSILLDDCYLSMEYLKKIYCFANNKKVYDGCFLINSGICIGYIMIDVVRRIGNIEKIENPMLTYAGDNIDFIHYNPHIEYVADIDHFYDTDEYKNNIFLKVYSKCFSDNVKKIIELLRRKG